MHDSISERWRTVDKISKLKETEFTFLKEYQTGNDLFTLKCSMQNPKDSLLTLVYLDKPYGNKYTKKLLKLDENNEVTVQLKLPAPSFIYFEDKEFNNAAKPGITFFYAEPQDTLILYVPDSEDILPLQISGTNARSNQVLWEIQKDHRLFYNLTPLYADEDAFRQAQNGTEKFFNFLDRNKLKLEKNISSFIENELIAIEYLHYFAFLNRYYADIISSEQKNIQQLEIELNWQKLLKIKS